MRVALGINDGGCGFGGAEISGLEIVTGIRQVGVDCCVYEVGRWSDAFKKRIPSFLIGNPDEGVDLYLSNQVWHETYRAPCYMKGRQVSIFRNGFKDWNCDREIEEYIAATGRAIFVSDYQYRILSAQLPILSNIQHFILPPPYFPIGKKRHDIEFPIIHIAKIGRDSPEKFSLNFSLAVLTMVSKGMKVTVVGGIESINNNLLLERLVDTVPSGVIPTASILDQIDILWADTGDETIESYGQIVHQAFCRGVPVVARRSGNYVHLIKASNAGLLYDDVLDVVNHIKNICDNYKCYSSAAIDWARKQPVISRSLMKDLVEWCL